MRLFKILILLFAFSFLSNCSKEPRCYLTDVGFDKDPMYDTDRIAGYTHCEISWRRITRKLTPYDNPILDELAEKEIAKLCKLYKLSHRLWYNHTDRREVRIYEFECYAEREVE